MEEYSENIDGNELIYDETLNDYEKVWNSCTKYVVLFAIAFLIIIGVSSAFFYFHWNLEKINTYVNTSANTNSKIGATVH